MKSFFLIIILMSSFIFLCNTAFGQSNKKHATNKSQKRVSDSVEYLHKSVEFINQVIGEKIKSPTFILLDKISDGESLGCPLKIADSLNFSKEELAFFKEKKYPLLNYWTKESFHNLTLIGQDTLNAIFRDKVKGWDYFHKNYGHCYYTFSLPVFFRNYTYCFFYSSNSYCERCGEGRLVLYIKNSKGKWLEMGTYCQWVI